MTTEKAIMQAAELPEAATAQIQVGLADLGDDAEADAIRDLTRSVTTSTREVYARALRRFEHWCRERGAVVIPAEPKTVKSFIGERSRGGASPQSLRVTLAAIRDAHLAQGCLSPTDHPLVRQEMRGATRTGAAERPDLRKQPLTAERELGLLIGAIRKDDEGYDLLDAVSSRPMARRHLAALRDEAIILLGFAGALRRSEIVALRIEDIRRVAEGAIVTVRRSKTGEEEKGQEIRILPGVRYCPIAAVDAWIDAARIESGPLFRRITRGAVVRNEGLTGGSIARLIKERAEAAGLDEEAFSGHSLRAGFLTSAANAGASIWKMMEQAGHKTVGTTRAYVRGRENFEEHAGKDLL